MQKKRCHNDKKDPRNILLPQEKLDFRIAKKLLELDSRHKASLGLLLIFLPGLISLGRSSQANSSTTTTGRYSKIFRDPFLVNLMMWTLEIDGRWYEKKECIYVYIYMYIYMYICVYIYMHDWVTMLYSRIWYNAVHQLYFNKKRKKTWTVKVISYRK